MLLEASSVPQEPRLSLISALDLGQLESMALVLLLVVEAHDRRLKEASFLVPSYNVCPIRFGPTSISLGGSCS